jgi:chemotaxis protein methyltransferase CheR
VTTTPAQRERSPLLAPPGDLERLELRLLLEGVHERYGFDFRRYAPASLLRRVRARLAAEGLPTISALQDRVLHDPGCMDRLLLGLTIHVTSMFRDPTFFRALREKVVPTLATYPFVRVWHAGCSSGEEVYSVAILLEEAGLLDRCRIYATDLSESVLRAARGGVFPLQAMRDYTQNYQAAGGTRAFSEYYTADAQHAVLRPALRRTTVFAQHNLVTDASFNEFHLVLCRNVMIYFDRELQERVHALLHESLAPRGVLALGRRESLGGQSLADRYDPIDLREQLHRKVR